MMNRSDDTAYSDELSMSMAAMLVYGREPDVPSDFWIWRRKSNSLTDIANVMMILREMEREK